MLENLVHEEEKFNKYKRKENKRSTKSKREKRKTKINIRRNHRAETKY